VAALVEAVLQLVEQAVTAAAITTAATIAATRVAATRRLSGAARRFGVGTTTRRFGGTTRGFRGTAARYFATAMVAVATQHSVEQFKRIGVGASKEKQASGHQARQSETRCHFRTPSKRGTGVQTTYLNTQILFGTVWVTADQTPREAGSRFGPRPN
jgi:hypothetical protein